MSKRLQVLLSEEDFAELKEVAKRSRLSVGEWVRRVLRRAAREEAAAPAERKLEAIAKGLGYAFPTADIAQMNREIEEGYGSGLR